MIHLLDVYCHPEKSIEILYELLQEREATQNISHKEMPTFEEHVKFVLSRPYQFWRFIVHRDMIVGSIYLSRQDEIGVFIFKRHQGRGYGTEAVKYLLALINRPLLANINPANQASIKMFEKLGFRHIQNTYRHD